MAKQNQNPATPAQGSGGDAENLFDHIVTQEDLDNNKELVENGVKVGDTIQLPVKEDEQPIAEQLTAETPEWIELIIASNEAVIASNQAVIDSIADFKESAVEFLKAGSHGEEKHSIKGEPFDEYASYEVAEGKAFRDPQNFSKEYTEGDDVTHLDNEALKRLYAQGYITEVE